MPDSTGNTHVLTTCFRLTARPLSVRVSSCQFGAGKEVKEVKLKVAYVSPAAATTTAAGTPFATAAAGASSAAAASTPSLVSDVVVGEQCMV